MRDAWSLPHMSWAPVNNVANAWSSPRWSAWRTAARQVVSVDLPSIESNGTWLLMVQIEDFGLSLDAISGGNVRMPGVNGEEGGDGDDYSR